MVLLIDRVNADDDDGILALVDNVHHLGRGLEGAAGGHGLGQLDVLLAVKELALCRTYNLKGDKKVTRLHLRHQTWAKTR